MKDLFQSEGCISRRGVFFKGCALGVFQRVLWVFFKGCIGCFQRVHWVFCKGCIGCFSKSALGIFQKVQ